MGCKSDNIWSFPKRMCKIPPDSLSAAAPGQPSGFDVKIRGKRAAIAAAVLSEVGNMTDADLLGVISECMMHEFNRRFILDLQVLGPSLLH